MDELLENDRIAFDCSCERSGVYAYTFASRLEVYLCPIFWVIPVLGTDSQAGTIVHELSHLNAVFGTRDEAYGQRAARELAARDPAAASRNADSWEYLAENTPELDMPEPPPVVIGPEPEPVEPEPTPDPAEPGPPVEQPAPEPVEPAPEPELTEPVTPESEPERPVDDDVEGPAPVAGLDPEPTSDETSVAEPERDSFMNPFEPVDGSAADDEPLPLSGGGAGGGGTAWWLLAILGALLGQRLRTAATESPRGTRYPERTP